MDIILGYCTGLNATADILPRGKQKKISLHTDTRGGDNVIIEAETRVMWPQAKNAGSHQKS